MLDATSGVKSSSDTSFVTNKLDMLHHIEGAESCSEHVDLRINDETWSMPLTLVLTIAEAAGLSNTLAALPHTTKSLVRSSMAVQHCA